MDLSTLKPAKGAVKKRRRVGRGPGSGRGGSSAKGTKGQKARAGYVYRPWFEGGQMPLQRRLPKRGFTNIHADKPEAVNLRDVLDLGPTIDAAVLYQKGLVSRPDVRVKILGVGDLTGPIAVRVHGVTAGARKKIEAAGGTIELIPVPRRPKRYAKKVRS